MAWYDTAPAVESPKSRWDRHGVLRGGDWNGATLGAGANGILAWTANADPAVLELDANGRLDYEYLRRGGDRMNLTIADPDGDLRADGRNQREFVNPYTKVSAITNSTHPDMADFVGNDTYVSGDQPAGYETFDNTP